MSREITFVGGVFDGQTREVKDNTIGFVRDIQGTRYVYELEDSVMKMIWDGPISNHNGKTLRKYFLKKYKGVHS